MPAPTTVNMVANGRTVAVPEDQVQDALDQGYKLESAEARYDRANREVLEDKYGGVAGQIAAGGHAILRGATLGASDVVSSAMGIGDEVRNLRDVNPGISTVGEVAGAVATAIPSGGESLLAHTPSAAAARLGARVAKTAEGASAAAKVGRAVAGGVVEGAVYGAGSGVGELALSDDPLTIEHVASTLSSRILYGGAIGGAAGGIGKAAELGLLKAKGALEEAAAARSAGRELPEDLAQLDREGLRGARTTELETIEAGRVPQRQTLADDIAAFRGETKEQKIWLATKGSKERAVREVGKISMEADKSLDRILRNPKRLAQEPKAALSALQQQEHALEQLAKQSDNLRAMFAADTTGERIAALDAVPAALEKNRALQGRIGELAKEPMSERLAAITKAEDVLKNAKPVERSLPEQMLQGSVFGTVTHAIGGLVGGPLGMVAPLIGAKAAKFVTERVFGRLGKAVEEGTARSAAAAAKFLDVGTKVTAAAPPLATRTLASVAFAPAKQPRVGERDPKPAKSDNPKLHELYRDRSEELRSLTAYDATGAVVMRPEARSQMAARLEPIRAAHPKIADQLETIGARRIEFLASKLPRKPDLGVLKTGPDLWRPNDMAMRTWARYVAAVEDPGAVEERLADGTVTPEDAEAMRAVYPERLADIQRRIIEQLPELRANLPYKRRLALSIFSGVPVDAAMHPRILRVLQAQYAEEDGSEGGTSAPRAEPQFGSVRSAEHETPSQARQDRSAL